MEQRIEKRDITFPRHAELMSEVNNLSIAVKLHYGVVSSKEDPSKLARAKESVAKPTWKGVADLLDKIHSELNDDRYSPVKY